MLSQPDGEREHIIAYASLSVSKTERNYSTTELECLAVKWGIWRMREYLEGYHFAVMTDHLARKCLEKMDNPSGAVKSNPNEDWYQRRLRDVEKDPTGNQDVD